jgi:hypothetical protein
MDRGNALRLNQFGLNPFRLALRVLKTLLTDRSRRQKIVVLYVFEDMLVRKRKSWTESQVTYLYISDTSSAASHGSNL